MPSDSASYAFVDWVFLGLGVLSFVAAFVFGSRPQGVAPVDYTSERFGTIKIAFPPLLVLVGVLFAGVGVFFRWQETQSRRSELPKLQAQVEELSQELARFKNYEMRVELDFHDSVDPAKLQTVLFLAKPGDSPRAIPQAPLESVLGKNILFATVSNLSPGDTFFFRATDTGSTPPRTWQSEQFIVPRPHLEMKLSD